LFLHGYHKLCGLAPCKKQKAKNYLWLVNVLLGSDHKMISESVININILFRSGKTSFTKLWCSYGPLRCQCCITLNGFCRSKYGNC
jgi:hypothetical protein